MSGAASRRAFDPARDVANAALILDDAGAWPNFHDAYVHALRFDRGDIRPDDQVWIGPFLDATFELTALEKPFVTTLRFRDMDGVTLTGFGDGAEVYDLIFGLRPRGFYADGVTPLSPYIDVTFLPPAGIAFLLRFHCLSVEVLERRDILRSD